MSIDLEFRPKLNAQSRSRLSQLSIPSLVLVVIGAAYVTLTAIMVGAGLLVMEFVVGGWVGDLDHDSTHWVADNRNMVLDPVTANFSNLADTFTVVGVAFGAGLILLLLRRWRELVVLAVALPVELAVFLTVTYTVSRPRPDVVPLDSVPSTASFPSGHMAAAIALYVSLAIVVRSLSVSPRVKRWALALAVIVTLGVGLSRVYRGLHHPTDIIAGAVLGLAAVAAGVLAARLIPEDEAP